MSITTQSLNAILEQLQTAGNVVIFQNTLPNSRFALKSGKECIFLNGQYATDIPAEVEELIADINAGNPHIFIDTAKVVIAKADLDPMEALKRKIIEEFKASQAAIQAGQSDYGNSDNGKLNVASTADVNAAASGSNSADAPAVNTAKIVPGKR